MKKENIELQFRIVRDCWVHRLLDKITNTFYPIRDPGPKYQIHLSTFLVKSGNKWILSNKEVYSVTPNDNLSPSMRDYINNNTDIKKNEIYDDALTTYYKIDEPEFGKSESDFLKKEVDSLTQNIEMLCNLENLDDMKVKDLLDLLDKKNRQKNEHKDVSNEQNSNEANESSEPLKPNESNQNNPEQKT